jgi:hypothetical protein
MILFLADVRVKVNRKTLMCKTSGGGTEICEIKKKHREERQRAEFGALGPVPCDQVVESYTGELGNIDPDGSGCSQVAYAQDLIHDPFYVNGNYTGAGDVGRLSYDGHPGFDYRASFGTEVYAAASGKVHYPTHEELKKGNIYIGGDPDKFNALQLDTNNGLKIYYLHLSTHPRTISINLTGDTTGQNFIAAVTGTAGSTTKGKLPPKTLLSISGQITLNGKPLPGVIVGLQGYEAGLNGKQACASASINTDANGIYLFTGLAAGFYHIRPSLAGYSFLTANPSVEMAQEGASVDAAGALIGLSGNAGPCLPPHLHFEVQKKAVQPVMTATGISLAYVPIDPYGWDGDPGTDPYEKVPGVKNARLWLHVPSVDMIAPQSASPGSISLTISGQGFDSSVVDCLIMKSNDYSNPVCIQGTVQSRTSGQLIVLETLSAGTYFVHVQNSDGRRSNWKKLVVQ